MVTPRTLQHLLVRSNGFSLFAEREMKPIHPFPALTKQPQCLRKGSAKCSHEAIPKVATHCLGVLVLFLKEMILRL